VFVVASAREGFNPTEVLFEFTGERRDTPPSRETGENATDNVRGSVEVSSPLAARDYKDAGTDGMTKNSAKLVVTNRLVSFGEYTDDGTASTMKSRDYKDATDLITVYENHPADSRVQDMGEVCNTVTSRWGTGGGNVPFALQAYSIREDAKANTFSATPLEVSTCIGSLVPSVQSHHAQTFIAASMAVRRLTPTECERLQGFPDGYTNVPFRKKPASDGPRYKALGNSWAVPVVAWIGKRINDAIT
jgi:DNA (cytosine-5)-methyltransferase 1